MTYIHHLGIGQRRFEVRCGLANGYVNNIRKSISPEKLQKIAQQNPGLNTGWLMTGEGEMLRASAMQTGDGNNNQQGNGNSYNSSTALDKALDEISEMRKLLADSLANTNDLSNRMMALLEKKGQ